MSPTIEEQIKRLKDTIAQMEAQRDSLGDAFVDKAVQPLNEKLAELNHLLEVSKSPPPEEPAQQRKLLTILFMDTVGSTSIIQHMDPEDVSEAFDRNLKRLSQPVYDHGGHVTSYMGDGFMAIFGAPTAREDDPERAVRAGLQILRVADEIARELEAEWGIKEFRVRVGVNTGLVLLGGETEGADTTKGPAINLAARLQSAAPPGGLLISHDTYQHIRGVFNVVALEPIKVKGFDESVRVYQVQNAKPRAFRSYTRGVEGVETRMVGRSSELKYLQDAFLGAVEDHGGQVVTIIGEAGVGKSRLLYEFQNWIDLQPSRVRFYEGRAHPEAQGMPLAMLRDLFEFRFQLQENDPVQTVRDKVEAGFSEVFAEVDEGQMRAHILGQWLGFDFSSSPHLKGVLSDAEQLRNRGLMYLGEYFIGLCLITPVIVFLEDIHWADDSSLDTLTTLAERLQHQPLLFTCAARHSLLERRPYWGEGLEYHHRLNLEPLSKRESHQLVSEIFKLADQVPAELFTLVVEGAEGNPFYVEELVKMLVEDGVVIKGDETWQVLPQRLSEIKVPSTLTGVLQARLESLPAEEQQILQQASVVGRLFWDQVVAHIQSAEGGRPQLVGDVLTSLRSREMIYRREASAFADACEYLFKHDILREVTYESVLKRLRRKYHGLVADWLVEQVASRKGAYSGLIAGHLRLAGRQEEAAIYFLQAGEAALASFANAEAEGYFREALKNIPVDEQKVRCLAGLGYATYLQGFVLDAAELIRQGIEICVNLGNKDGAAYLYAGLASFLWMDDYGKAWEACQEGLRRLEGAPESPGMAALLAEAARASFFLAKYDGVISLCQQAIEMGDKVEAQEAKAQAMITLALCEPDYEQAIQLLQEAITISEANGLWSSAARAHTNIGVLASQNFTDAEAVMQHHQQVINIYLRIGDVEALLFGLPNLAESLKDIGQLPVYEERLLEILHKSTATQSRIDHFCQEIFPVGLLFRGEWTEFLVYIRQRLVGLREARKYQIIASTNIFLVFASLDLQRFGAKVDFSEAETALRENITLNCQPLQSRFLLAVVMARQGRIVEAHDQLSEAIRGLVPPVYKEVEVAKLIAEAEVSKEEGRWDAAISASQALIDIYQPGGYRWYHAWALISLGDALLGRNLPGDQEHAGQVYRQSLEMFTKMEAPGYIELLEGRLHGMQAIP